MYERRAYFIIDFRPFLRDGAATGETPVLRVYSTFLVFSSLSTATPHCKKRPGDLLDFVFYVCGGTRAGEQRLQHTTYNTDRRYINEIVKIIILHLTSVIFFSIATADERARKSD